MCVCVGRELRAESSGGRGIASHVLLGFLVGPVALLGLLFYADRAEAQQVPFVEFNACGQTKNNPACSSHGSGWYEYDTADNVRPPPWDDAFAPAIGRSIVDRCVGLNNCPPLVFLNEVCRGQLDDLLYYLNAVGWTYSGYFGKASSEGWYTCPRSGNGYDFGNAVLWRGPAMSSAERYELPNPQGRELRSMVCLFGYVWGNSASCATHLTPDAPTNQFEQTIGVAMKVNYFTGAGLRTTLGGDLNMTPFNSNMARLYPWQFGYPPNHGTTTELTTGHSAALPYDKNDTPATKSLDKIDYIFSSFGWISRGTASTSTMSDHRVVQGWAGI